jgi:hypothetical protein
LVGGRFTPEGTSAAGVSNAIASKSNTKIVYPGDDWESEYSKLASDAKDAIYGDLTADNRRAMIMMPGTYTTSSAFQLIQYTDLIGVGEPTIDSSFGGKTAVLIPVLTSDEAEEDITNYIEGVIVKAPGQCFGTGITSEYRRNIIMRDCGLIAESPSGAEDCIFIGTGFNECDVDMRMYSCDLYSNYDGIAIAGSNAVVRAFGCNIVSEGQEGEGDFRIAPVYIQYAGEFYGYGCNLVSINDQSGNPGTDLDADASCVRMADFSNSGIVELYGCSLETTATAKGAGTAGGDGIHISVGTNVCRLFACNFISSTENDINATTGSVEVAACVLNSSVSGTVVYKNNVGSDGDTGGAGSAGAGNQYIEIEVEGTVYKVLHDGTI